MKGRHRRPGTGRGPLLVGGGALVLAVLVVAALFLRPWEGSVGDRLATDEPLPTSTSLPGTSPEPSTSRPPSSTTTTTALPEAPWAAAPLRADQAPAVVVEEWKKAGSPADCRALAPAALGPAGGATPRRANFGTGAWALAYDKPGLPGTRPSGEPCPDCGRGAVLVAGTSLDAEDDEERSPGVLPTEVRWADGSVAHYGLEAGDGPDHLAYLEVAGQRCLYNVKSSVGEEHLVFILDHLRFVEGAP